MATKYDYEVELINDKNETVSGILTIEHFPLESIDSDDKSPPTSLNPHTVEKDPDGAVTYVITVVLLYGLAIIFMIASHVFVKKKEERLENQIQLVNKYIAQAPRLRERGARESYRKLKHSIVPVVAKSGARDLISRRKSFAPLLADAGILLDSDAIGRRLSIHSESASSDDEDSGFCQLSSRLHTPPGKPFLEVPRKLSDTSSARRLPSITEEDLPTIEYRRRIEASVEEGRTKPVRNGAPAFVITENETANTRKPTNNGSLPYRYDYRIPSHAPVHSPRRQPDTFQRQVPVIIITDEGVADKDASNTDIQEPLRFSQDLAPDLSQMELNARCMSIESLSPYQEEPDSISPRGSSNTSESDTYSPGILEKAEGGDLYQITWVSETSLHSAYTYGLSSHSPSSGNRSPFSGDLQQADTDETFFL